MPRNTGTGVILGGLSVVLGFGLIWHMWLLAGLAFIAMLGATIWHTFDYDRDYHIAADAVVTAEDARTALLSGRSA